MFQSVDNNVRFPELEERILQFWSENRIYEKSLANRQGAKPFVFYEGPPTANGLPHPGHCLTRAIKDLFPRYKTMRGYRCDRKAGWDTHGLPVEVEVCKELGIHSKEEIEAYGVEPFIQKCQQSVWRYMQQWRRLTERLGFWVNLDDAYVTYHQSYVESVWWSLAEMFNRGLLYQGHKIVWWWAQGGTALSAGEVGLGYREVADPSVYVRFPLLDDAGKETDTSLLVWTTTPWTLPSNQFAAVHPELEYSVVVDPEDGQKLVMASALVETIAGKVKRELTVERTLRGTELVGRRYVPPFDYYYKSQGQKTALTKDGSTLPIAWRVVAADFVTIDSGTGVVHQAPAFGEVDFDVLMAEQAHFSEGEGPELICAVGSDGKFTAEAPDYEGRWVKEADKDIARDLKRRGLLYHHDQYLHEYPFCWRAEEDPLIQYPRRSWFVRTTAFKDAMLANNAQINWLPEHIKEGRFGNFLESNVDWALSRERYWGTPLPIWVCEKTGKMEAVSSYDELLAKKNVHGVDVWEKAKAENPELPDDLQIHKPYIDAVTYESPFSDGARMIRVPDVIDCWYDSGAMPFAQWGYRGEGGPADAVKRFSSQFPADFISEAIDQTRGWFYSQLAISTVLFGEGTRGWGLEAGKEGLEAWDQGLGTRKADTTPSSFSPQSPAPSLYPIPFRNCIVLGLMLGEDGQKMSKSKRNYREPREIFDKYGADALRWYFFANQPPWTSIRYSEQSIKDSIPEFLLRLWNCYSFFVIYAGIDEFDPASEGLAAKDWGLGDGKDEGGRMKEERRASGASPDTRHMSPGHHSPLTTHHSPAGSLRPVRQRRELDQWILSELNRTLRIVTERMDAYDNYGACGQITSFVDALSNWWVRRSRERFWSADKRDPDKLDAYWTLYECLVTTTRMIAPFVPFVAEALWQNLARGPFGETATESVHLCDWPVVDESRIDDRLAARAELIREIVSLGRNARTAAKLKVRQPLSKVEVILADSGKRDWVSGDTWLIADELNVKAVEFPERADEYITYQVLPDFKRLGPRVGKLMPAVKKALAEADGGRLLAELNSSGKIPLDLGEQTVELDSDDVQIRLAAKEGWAAAQGSGCVVVLSTELTDELIEEGVANEIVRVIQDRRKEMGLEFTDRIEIGIVTESDLVRRAVAAHREYIMRETLAIRLVDEPLAGVEPLGKPIEGEPVTFYVKKATDSRGNPAPNTQV